MAQIFFLLQIIFYAFKKKTPPNNVNLRESPQRLFSTKIAFLKIK